MSNDDISNGEYTNIITKIHFFKGNQEKNWKIYVFLGAGAPIWEGFEKKNRFLTNDEIVEDLINEIENESSVLIRKIREESLPKAADCYFEFLKREYKSAYASDPFIRKIWQKYYGGEKIIPIHYYRLADFIITGLIDGVLTTNVDESLRSVFMRKEKIYKLGTNSLRPFPQFLISEGDFSTFNESYSVDNKIPFIAKLHGTLSRYQEIKVANKDLRTELSKEIQDFIIKLLDAPARSFLIFIGWSGKDEFLKRFLSSILTKYKNKCDIAIVDIANSLSHPFYNYLIRRINTSNNNSNIIYCKMRASDFIEKLNTYCFQNDDLYSYISKIWDRNISRRYNRYQSFNLKLIKSKIPNCKNDIEKLNEYITPWCEKYLDPIYGEIDFKELFQNIFREKNFRENFFNLMRDLIMCPEFFKLKSIKQLSFCDYIYPNCNHSRWEHSIGVCYLIIKLIEKNELLLNKLDQIKGELILAGLLHDVGHITYCHILELLYKHTRLFTPNNFKEILGHTHEEIGAKLILDANSIFNKVIVKYNKNYNLNLNIENIVKLAKLRNNLDDQEQYSNLWLTNIISDTTIDLDRLDYILRDSKYAFNSNINNIIENIINSISIKNESDHLIYYDKDIVNKLIESYINLWKEVYMHPHNRMIQVIISEILQFYFKMGIIDIYTLTTCTDEELISIIQEINIPIYNYAISAIKNRRLLFTIEILINETKFDEYFKKDYGTQCFHILDIAKQFISRNLTNFSLPIEHNAEDFIRNLILAEIPYDDEKFPNKMNNLLLINENGKIRKFEEKIKEFKDIYKKSLRRIRIYLGENIFNELNRTENIENFKNNIKEKILTKI
ncbi:MAG: SIR2 family protein [Promethearchaeota archaeon]